MSVDLTGSYLDALARSTDDVEQDQYHAAFAAFQQNFHYDASTFLAHPDQEPSQSPPIPESARHGSLLSMPDIDLDLDNLQGAPDDLTPGEPVPGRSSSEEKDTMTPQQSKRKAQNRAAQRAFRERKEKHVKELEAKLTTLQQQSASLNDQNERLRRELAKIATENEILRATSGSAVNGQHPFVEDPDELVGPLGYVPTDNTKARLGETNGEGGQVKSKYSHFGSIRTLALDEDTGEPLLGAGATWDYLQQHELCKQGLVDVGVVCERLKNVARCDGQGPVFTKKDVRQAIEDSAVAGGRDELI